MSSVSRHKKLVHNCERYSCEKCIMQFRSKYRRAVHMEKEHDIKREEMKKEHKCTECEREFLHGHGLHEHVIAEHTNTSFLCLYCNQEFKRLRILRRHVNKRHRELSFKYEEALKEGKSLLQHIESRNLPMSVLKDEDLKAVNLYIEYRDKMKNIY